MNTKVDNRIDNENTRGRLQFSLSSVSVNVNSHQDHVQHAIDSELNSL